jgi:hypothetical protein
MRSAKIAASDAVARSSDGLIRDREVGDVEVALISSDQKKPSRRWVKIAAVAAIGGSRTFLSGKLRTRQSHAISRRTR